MKVIKNNRNKATVLIETDDLAKNNINVNELINGKGNIKLFQEVLELLKWENVNEISVDCYKNDITEPSFYIDIVAISKEKIFTAKRLNNIFLMAKNNKDIFTDTSTSLYKVEDTYFLLVNSRLSQLDISRIEEFNVSENDISAAYVKEHGKQYFKEKDLLNIANFFI